MNLMQSMFLSDDEYARLMVEYMELNIDALNKEIARATRMGDKNMDTRDIMCNECACAPGSHFDDWLSERERPKRCTKEGRMAFQKAFDAALNTGRVGPSEEDVERLLMERFDNAPGWEYLD